MLFMSYFVNLPALSYLLIFLSPLGLSEQLCRDASQYQLFVMCKTLTHKRKDFLVILEVFITNTFTFIIVTIYFFKCHKNIIFIALLKFH